MGPEFVITEGNTTPRINTDDGDLSNIMLVNDNDCVDDDSNNNGMVIDIKLCDKHPSTTTITSPDANTNTLEGTIIITSSADNKSEHSSLTESSIAQQSIDHRNYSYQYTEPSIIPFRPTTTTKV